MRAWLAVRSFSLSAVVALLGCKSAQQSTSPPPPPSARAVAALLPSGQAAAPVSSEVVGFEKTLQARKLVPPARSDDCPLAFGKGVLGQLTNEQLRLFDTTDWGLLGTAALAGARTLLSLADGALLAVGASVMLRWERGQKRPTTLPKPLLLPGARIYADAQQPDLIWVFDGGRSASGRAQSATLGSYRLPGAKERDVQQAVLLPEQTLELGAAQRSVLGLTREGVWLHLMPGQAERFSPGGLRLHGLKLDDQPLPTWVLPARRLDQSLWVEEAGQVSRVLVTPSYKRLAGARLAGKAVAADVGNDGRLLAVVEVTGPGPRFELELLDQDLAPLSRVILPADEPTGTDDWVDVVTRNQAVVVAAREPVVAVGGPERMTIFDAQGQQLFSIPSK